MSDVTVGLELGGSRRKLKFPDLRMLFNFAVHSQQGQLEPTDQAVRLVDVGACVGGWTAAQLLNAPNARVDAVEPNPYAWPYLAHNLGWSRRVTIHKLAASDAAGDALLAPDHLNMGKTSLYGDGANVAVVTRPLDDIIGGQVDLLKIDAEGHELKVLAGAERILREWRPVVLVEVLGTQMKRGGWNAATLTAGMAARGYGEPEQATANDWLFRPVKG